MSLAFDVAESDLVENPTPRVPVALCLDTSGSMEGQPIRELADGVNLFFESVKRDEIARYSAEIAVVSFSDGDARKHTDFASVERQDTVEFQACGTTPMAKGVSMALDLLEERKAEYRKAGVDYYQPWLILMTDGAPTENIESVVRRVADLVEDRRLSVFAIGIGDDADMDTLAKFTPNRSPLRLVGLEFGKFFEWLSQSVQRVSASMPGEAVELDTDGIRGWGTV